MAGFENVTVGLHDSLTGGGGGLQKLCHFHTLEVTLSSLKWAPGKREV